MCVTKRMLPQIRVVLVGVQNLTGTHSPYVFSLRLSSIDLESRRGWRCCYSWSSVVWRGRFFVADETRNHFPCCFTTMRILARPIVWATFLTLHHQYYQRTCGLTSAFPVKSIVSSRSPFRTLLTTISSSLTATTSAELTKLSMTRTEKASYIDYVSQTVSEAVGTLVELESTMGGGYSGGGGAQTGAIKDAITGKRYFIKAARDGADMLQAEYFGVKEMSDTNTIRCPRPVAFGVYEPTNMAFCVFEYLEFCGGGSQDELGRQLAKMHRHFSDKGFGFHIDNTIGATPQPNGWKDTWVDFWLEHRLGHMLKLTGDAGLSKEKVKQLQEKHRELLAHQPQPSLIHGDLWGGNKGFCRGEGGRFNP